MSKFVTVGVLLAFAFTVQGAGTISYSQDFESVGSLYPLNGTALCDYWLSGDYGGNSAYFGSTVLWYAGNPGGVATQIKAVRNFRTSGQLAANELFSSAQVSAYLFNNAPWNDGRIQSGVGILDEAGNGYMGIATYGGSTLYVYKVTGGVLDVECLPGSGLNFSPASLVNAKTLTLDVQGSGTIIFSVSSGIASGSVTVTDTTYSTFTQIVVGGQVVVGEQHIIDNVNFTGTVVVDPTVHIYSQDFEGTGIWYPLDGTAQCDYWRSSDYGGNDTYFGSTVLWSPGNPGGVASPALALRNFHTSGLLSHSEYFTAAKVGADLFNFAPWEDGRIQSRICLLDDASNGYMGVATYGGSLLYIYKVTGGIPATWALTNKQFSSTLVNRKTLTLEIKQGVITLSVSTPGLNESLSVADTTYSRFTKIGLGAQVVMGEQHVFDNVTFSGTVAQDPTSLAFSPDRGILGSAQDVTITCATPDAVIRYTVDGSDPSDTNGNVIVSGGTVPVNQSLTLKARATVNGTVGTVKTITFNITGVTISDQGICKIDGKPFFPIGIFHIWPDILGYVNDVRAQKSQSPLDWRDWFSQLKDGGFNSFMDYRNGREAGEFTARYDIAAELGFKALIHPSLECDSDILTLKNHAGVLGWYTFDEPSGNGVSTETLAARRSHILSLDPNHPQVGADNNYLGLSWLSGYVDSLMPDFYPGAGGDMSALGNAVAFGCSLRNNLAIWPIVQSFQITGAIDRLSENEIRCQVYDAIIRGAKGIYYYAYYTSEGPQELPDGGIRAYYIVDDFPDQWNAMSVVNQEIAVFAPAVVSGETSLTTLNSTVVHAATFLDGNNAILVIANPTRQQQQVVITNGAMAGLVGTKLVDGTTITANLNGQINLTLGALAAEAYQFTVTVVPPPIPGDANLDGAVDVGDLGILAANYGGSGKTWALGDFNGDGLVDVGDLGILAAHYGQGSTQATNFSDDSARVFGTTAVDDPETKSETSNSVCGSLGLPLVAGFMLIGLLWVKLDE